MKEIMRNVYLKDGNLFTKSSYGSHYGEKVFSGYREWIPWRSKLAAMILKGYRIPFSGKEKALYLGAAAGTTVSHLADILDEGIIYAVEYAAKPFVKLLELAKERENVVPLLFDASKPQMYSGIVEKVDFIYQDISQRNQVEILEKNIEFFLKKEGSFLMMVKARSIDSTASPAEVFKEVTRRIEERFELLATDSLEPYHRDHIFIHGKI